MSAELLSSVRGLALRGLVSFGGDSSLSMGGLQVEGSDVHHALSNALSAVSPNGADVIVSGPALDGVVFRVICRVSFDMVHVRDVAA